MRRWQLAKYRPNLFVQMAQIVDVAGRSGATAVLDQIMSHYTFQLVALTHNGDLNEIEGEINELKTIFSLAID